MMKAMVVALSLAAGLLVVVAVSLAAPAGAQGGLAAPGNVRVVDGANAGEVTVSWDGVDDAAFYRIGWVASDRIAAVQAAGQEWLDAFAFADVANRGQTAHTLTDLAPGMRYAFSIGSIDVRFGAARWSEWAYLTLAEAPTTSCPTAPIEPIPTLTPTPSPTSTPQPTPVGTDSYDADQDRLIEVANLVQLDAIRHDLDGDGVSTDANYAVAFPNAVPGMGCPDAGCIGYELVADLDFDTNGNGRVDEDDAYWGEGYGWVPIGYGKYRFTADFDGNSHTIANLYINRSETDYVGLFGSTAGVSIKRVRLADATVSGASSVGALAGNIGGNISDSYVTGSVSGNGDDVGGLVGYLSGIISASYAICNVSGSGDYVGGLVGSQKGLISTSYATGSVSGGGHHIGGLVGEMVLGSISASYATGNVSGSGDDVGGLVGYQSGIISVSYAIGSVSGSGDSVGGLVGRTSGGSISASYATGSVSGGGDYVGGLVGVMAGGSITHSYAVGRVSGADDVSHIGGLVGGSRQSWYNNKSPRITESYWDTETTGQSRSPGGGSGQTTSAMQVPTGATFIYAGWDPDWWDFGTVRQYPVLKYGGLDVAAQRR